jgi:hypothetical protein
MFSRFPCKRDTERILRERKNKKASISILMKGNENKPENYRGIYLSTLKSYSMMISEYLTNKLELQIKRAVMDRPHISVETICKEVNLI